MSDNKWYMFGTYGSLMAARYDAITQTLETQNGQGKISSYTGVPPHLWTELRQSTSKESFFDEKIFPVWAASINAKNVSKNTDSKKSSASFYGVLELARELEDKEQKTCNEFIHLAILYEKLAALALTDIKSDKNRAFCMCNQACCLYWAGNIDEAIKILTEANDFQDDLVDACGNLNDPNSDTDMDIDIDLIDCLSNLYKIKDYVDGLTKEKPRLIWWGR